MKVLLGGSISSLGVTNVGEVLIAEEYGILSAHCTYNTSQRRNDRVSSDKIRRGKLATENFSMTNRIRRRTLLQL